MIPGVPLGNWPFSPVVWKLALNFIDHFVEAFTTWNGQLLWRPDEVYAHFVRLIAWVCDLLHFTTDHWRVASQIIVNEGAPGHCCANMTMGGLVGDFTCIDINGTELAQTTCEADLGGVFVPFGICAGTQTVDSVCEPVPQCRDTGLLDVLLNLDELGPCVLYVLADIVDQACCFVNAFLDGALGFLRAIYNTVIGTIYTVGVRSFVVGRILAESFNECNPPGNAEIDPDFVDFCTVLPTPNPWMDFINFQYGERNPVGPSDLCPDTPQPADDDDDSNNFLLICDHRTCFSDRDCADAVFAGAVAAVCDAHYKRCVRADTALPGGVCQQLDILDEPFGQPCVRDVFGVGSECDVGFCGTLLGNNTCLPAALAPNFDCGCECTTNEFRQVTNAVVEFARCIGRIITALFGQDGVTLACIITNAVSLLMEALLVFVQLLINLLSLLAVQNAAQADALVDATQLEIAYDALMECIKNFIITLSARVAEALPPLPIRNLDGSLNTAGVGSDAVSAGVRAAYARAATHLNPELAAATDTFKAGLCSAWECIAEIIKNVVVALWDFNVSIRIFFNTGAVAITILIARIIEILLLILGLLFQLVGSFLVLLDETAGTFVIEAGDEIKEAAEALAIIATELLLWLGACIAGAITAFLALIECVACAFIDLVSPDPIEACETSDACGDIIPALQPCWDALLDLFADFFAFLFDFISCTLFFAGCLFNAPPGEDDALRCPCDDGTTACHFDSPEACCDDIIDTCKDINILCFISDLLCEIFIPISVGDAPCDACTVVPIWCFIEYLICGLEVEVVMTALLDIRGAFADLTDLELVGGAFDPLVDAMDIIISWFPAVFPFPSKSCCVLPNTPDNAITEASIIPTFPHFGPIPNFCRSPFYSNSLSNVVCQGDPACNARRAASQSAASEGCYRHINVAGAQRCMTPFTQRLIANNIMGLNCLDPDDEHFGLCESNDDDDTQSCDIMGAPLGADDSEGLPTLWTARHQWQWLQYLRLQRQRRAATAAQPPPKRPTAPGRPGAAAAATAVAPDASFMAFPVRILAPRADAHGRRARAHRLNATDDLAERRRITFTDAVRLVVVQLNASVTLETVLAHPARFGLPPDIAPRYSPADAPHRPRDAAEHLRAMRTMLAAHDAGGHLDGGGGGGTGASWRSAFARACLNAVAGSVPPGAPWPPALAAYTRAHPQSGGLGGLIGRMRFAVCADYLDSVVRRSHAYQVHIGEVALQERGSLIDLNALSWHITQPLRYLGGALRILLDNTHPASPGTSEADGIRPLPLTARAGTHLMPGVYVIGAPTFAWEPRYATSVHEAPAAVLADALAPTLGMGLQIFTDAVRRLEARPPLSVLERDFPDAPRTRRYVATRKLFEHGARIAHKWRVAGVGERITHALHALALRGSARLGDIRASAARLRADALRPQHAWAVYSAFTRPRSPDAAAARERLYMRVYGRPTGPSSAMLAARDSLAEVPGRRRPGINAYRGRGFARLRALHEAHWTRIVRSARLAPSTTAHAGSGGEDGSVSFTPFICDPDATAPCFNCSYLDRIINGTVEAFDAWDDYYGGYYPQVSSPKLVKSIETFNFIDVPDTWATHPKTVPPLSDRLLSICWPWKWDWADFAANVDPRGVVFEIVPKNASEFEADCGTAQQRAENCYCDTPLTVQLVGAGADDPYNGTLVPIFSTRENLPKNAGRIHLFLAGLEWIGEWSTSLRDFFINWAESMGRILSSIGTNGTVILPNFIDHYLRCDYPNDHYCWLAGAPRDNPSAVLPDGCCSDTCEPRAQGTSLLDGLVIAAIISLIPFVIGALLPICSFWAFASAFLLLFYWPMAMAIAYGGSPFCYMPGLFFVLLPILMGILGLVDRALALFNRCILCAIIRLPLGFLMATLMYWALVPGTPACFPDDAYELFSEAVPPCYPLNIQIIDVSNPAAAERCSIPGNLPPIIDCAVQSSYMDGTDNLLYMIEVAFPGTNQRLADSRLGQACPWLAAAALQHTTEAIAADPHAAACNRRTIWNIFATVPILFLALILGGVMAIFITLLAFTGIAALVHWGIVQLVALMHIGRRWYPASTGNGGGGGGM
jgi:hypothetical protein